MYCNQCGTELRINAKYCEGCGVNVKSLVKKFKKKVITKEKTKMENKDQNMVMTETVAKEATMETAKEVTNESTKEKKDFWDIWFIVQDVCCFLPILTTVMFVISYAFDIPKAVDDCIMAPIAIVGWIAALLTGPVKFIKNIFNCASTGWIWGGSALGLAGALFGGGIGAVVGLAAFLFVPAVFTVPLFFKD